MQTNIDNVCNWVKSKRKSNNRNNYRKRITIKLFKENNRQISARLFVQYQKNTNNIVLSHSILYLKRDYSPNINPNKLKCVDLHTIEQYNKTLKYRYLYIKEKTVFNKICKNIGLGINIKYNVNTKHITIHEYLKYKGNFVKIKFKK